MQCVYCGAEMQLRQEHCPRCGKKAVVDMDSLTASVHDDAAVRRTQKIEAYLKWAILALLVVGSVIYGLNDLNDKKLVYDGSDVPVLPLPASLPIKINIPTLSKPYADPRPNTPAPRILVSAFSYRKEPIKGELRGANRGDFSPEKYKSIQTAVQQALNYLQLHQDSDGQWYTVVLPHDFDQYTTADYRWGNTGITGLCLLAFFGEGETVAPDPNVVDTAKYPYHKTITKAIRALLLSQDPTTGRFGPGEGERVNFMYNHGMATLAMCEAAGLIDDHYVRESARKGIKFILDTQTTQGGWNYKGKKDGNNDSSLSAWQVQALVAAKEAGIDVPADALNKALADALEFYRKATQADGYVKYWLEKDDNEDKHKIGLCGTALMIRQLLGEDAHQSGDLRKLADVLTAHVPITSKTWGGDWRPNQPKNDDSQRGLYDPYMVYFSTYGLYFMGGKNWQTWHEGQFKDKDGKIVVEGMKKAILDMQSTDGSWKCNDVNSYCGGTFYSTALSVLTLQVYYRVQ